LTVLPISFALECNTASYKLMPGPLRKLQSTPSVETLDGSRCTSRLEPLETPSKRRRLVIKGAACPPCERLTASAGSCEPEQLSLTAEVSVSTPSCADGVSIDSERIQRLFVSVAAREAVNAFVCSRRDDQAAPSTVDDLRLRAQVLACYYVQVFFMSTSLTREDLGVTAIAAAVTALRTLEVCCGEEDILHLWGSRHSAVKETKLQEESDAEILAKLSLVGARLSQTVGKTRSAELLDFDKPLQSLARQMLEKLSNSEFANADVAAAELKQVAQRFIVDAFQGLGPVILSLPALVGGALVMATKLIGSRRSCLAASEDELISLLCTSSEPCLTQSELRRAVSEIAAIYRSWVVAQPTKAMN